MPFVGAGLGENFDAPVSDLVELGRKWILVDANLADRGFGRKLPSGETVDVKLASVGTCGRTSEGFQISLQFVGVIRQSIQFFAGDSDGACVVRRVYVHRRSVA